MALIDRILLRNAEETARAEGMREFRRLMPSKGKFSEFAESGITSYYDSRFGRFGPAIDSWNDHPQVLKANPQLRRVDVIADTVFESGSFRLRGLGPVRSESGKPEGSIAAISLSDNPGTMIGMLTLDVASEIRFSKLRIGTASGGDYVVRPSSLDHGLVIYPNRPMKRELPEAVSDKAEGIIAIFQTVEDAILALQSLLRGKSV